MIPVPVWVFIIWCALTLAAVFFAVGFGLENQRLRERLQYVKRFVLDYQEKVNRYRDEVETVLRSHV